MREMGRVVGAAAVLVCAGLWTSSADADVIYGTLATGRGQSSLVTIDVKTGFITQVGGVGYGVTSLAYNPVDQQLYGADAYHLYRINTATGQGTLVGAFWGGSGSSAQPSGEETGSGSDIQTSAEPNYDYVNGAVTSIAFDSFGSLYALQNPGLYYAVDPDTAQRGLEQYGGFDYGARLGIWGTGNQTVAIDQNLAMVPLDLGSAAGPSTGTLAGGLTSPNGYVITRIVGLTTNHDPQIGHVDSTTSSELPGLSSESGSDMQTSAESSESGSGTQTSAESSEAPAYPVGATLLSSSEESSEATSSEVGSAYSSEVGSAYSSEAGSSYSSETGSSVESGSVALPAGYVGPNELWGLFNFYDPGTGLTYRALGVVDPYAGTVGNVVLPNFGDGGLAGSVSAVAFAPSASVVPSPAAAGGGVVLAGGYVAACVWRGRRRRGRGGE
jgi:hypothetical protein